MGGFGALDLAGFRRFCAVGGHSAAMWRTGGETPQGAFDNAENFEWNDVIEAAGANPHLYGDAEVWIDIGTGDPFLSANEELVRNLSGEHLRLWRGDHDFSHFERDAPRVMRFYADALASCSPAAARVAARPRPRASRRTTRRDDSPLPRRGPSGPRRG
jgi:hypothetical protein